MCNSNFKGIKYNGIKETKFHGAQANVAKIGPSKKINHECLSGALVGVQANPVDTTTCFTAFGNYQKILFQYYGVWLHRVLIG